MTAQTRSVNKARFEQGDKPQGSDYEDLLDSIVMLAETSTQAMSGPLQTTLLIAATVSAGTVFADKVEAIDVSASTGTINSLTATGIAVTTVTANEAYVSAGHFTDVSAATVRAGTVSAATVNLATLQLSVETTASAAGGTVDAVPTTAAGYLVVSLSGTNVLVPYFPI